MGVVKSDFLCIKILLILFSFNQFVNSQEWEDPYFSDAQTEGIEFVPGADIKLKVNEQLTESTLVIVNYNGEEKPVIDDSQDKDEQFIKDFRPDVVRKDDHWIITIQQSVDFESIKVDSYKPKLAIGDISKFFYVDVINLDDETPSLQADSIKCEVVEGFVGETNCIYTVKDNDGCATFTSVAVSNEDENKIFSFKMDDKEDFEYPACLASTSDLKKEAKLHLEVEADLDFETIRSYFLDLIVQDKAGHSSTVEVVINVKDIPDVAPIWTSSISTYTVDELKEETFLLTAKDGDTNIGADICYNLTVESDVSDEEKNYFEINHETGLVTVHEIDRDKFQRNTYSMQIFALECEDPGWNVDLDISVLVKDVNNNIPKICIRNITAEENDVCLDQVEIYLEEGKSTTLSSFISIEISDPDEGNKGTFQVTLEDDPSSTFNWHEAFQIIPNQGYQKQTFIISVADAFKLDYENENWRDIKLNVVAVEDEDKDHNQTIPISILLINLNDELPKILNLDANGALSVTVTENLPINTIIFTVQATDADGDEDKIKFGLVQAKTLKIDPDTGTITTNSDNVFDYELQQQMVVQVYAEDSMGDDAKHTVFATLTITIEDENDVPPQIALSASTIDVLESEEIGYVLPVSIVGTDVDTNSSLEFRINWDTSTGRHQFVDVDPDVFKGCYDIIGEYNRDGDFIGALTVAKKLSWNDVDSIKLVLIIEDLYTESGDRAKEATLSINIRDVNDHNPVFTSCEEKVLTIAENAPTQIRITNSQIIAEDEDSSENGNNAVQYYIEPNYDNYDDYVSIDPDSGYLFTGMATIDFEKFQVLEYTVIAHNEGGPDGGSTTCQIKITVTDANDEIPTKDEIEATTVDIKEDVKSGQHITNLKYHDDDISAPFKKIKYEISDRNLLKYFKINDNGDGNAELVVDFSDDAKFDYDEGEKFYDVKINIYDNPDHELGEDSQTADPLPTIRINLIDVNNHAPFFDDDGSPTENPKECFFTASEDNKQGNRLSNDSILAVDKDSEAFGTINYNLISVTCVAGTNYKCLSPEDAKELFEVVKTGKEELAYVAAKKNLLNLFGEYIIELTANDGGDPPLSSDPRFYKGCIFDENDHQPAITYPDVQSLIIRKGEGGGIVQNDNNPIPLFTAVDEDFGEYAVVTFYIKAVNPDDEVPFQLSHVIENSFRFELKNGLTFDDLNEELYSLTVKACNGRETEDCPSRSLNVYRINTKAAEPYWEDGDREQEHTFTEGDINDAKNQYSVPKATDPNDFDIPGEDPYREPIFYYIKSGTDNYTSFFEIDSATGKITLLDNLDCEYRTNWTLQIQASNFDDLQNIPADPDAKSLLTLKITVDDINDKPPQFKEKVYTTSVSDDSESGFLMVEAPDPDKGASVTYRIVPGSVENHVEGGSQIDLEKVFTIDSTTGAVSFNAKIDATFRGYLTVNISATDSKFGDTCVVKVYIISASVKVGFNFRNSREQVVQNGYGAADVFSQYFNYECVVGKIAIADGTDEMETTMWVHFNDESGYPVPSSEIKILQDDAQLIKNLTNELISKFSLYLTNIDGNTNESAEPEENYLVRTVLIAVCAVLGFLLLAMLALYIFRTRNLRKLVGNLTKATAPQEDKGNFALPNTNQYNNEGSNPVFNANINTQQLDQLDNSSLSSNDSSLIGIEDNPEFQAFYNNVILKSEGKTDDDDLLKENPQLNAFISSDNSAFNF